MAKTIELEFEGCFEEGDFPLDDKYNCSGIYTVYTGIPKPLKECILKELLYIGEAKNLSERLDICSNRP